MSTHHPSSVTDLPVGGLKSIWEFNTPSFIVSQIKQLLFKGPSHSSQSVWQLVQIPLIVLRKLPLGHKATH